MMMMMLIRLNLCLLFFLFPATTQATFNLEVERRVIDRLTDYLGNPLDAAALTSNFRRNGGFRYGMEGRDRDDYLKFAYSLTQNTVYFGLEDGTCLGYYVNVVFYREPGFAGYLPEENPEHYASCVDATTGEQKNCQMQKGASYVRCVNNCALELCPNATDIWCKQYEIAQMGSEEPLGFLPLTYSCHDELGKLTQEPGKAFRREGGNCMFRDGKTLVNRTLAGTYHYCQAKDVCDAAVTTEPQVCDDTFVGGFRSDDYDPRYRPWYTLTKEFQAPNWAAPYPFFDNLDIGVTFSHPIYDYEGDKKIFAGVLAIDYTCK